MSDAFSDHPLHPGESVPLFIAAGVLKEPAQLVPFLSVEDPKTVPVLTLGSFTLNEWAGNAEPGETDFVYYEDRQKAGNARGLPNPGIEGIVRLQEPIKVLGQLGIKTIISITNLPHEDPLAVIPDLAYAAAEVRPTAIEVNLSCPNGLAPDGSLHEPVCYNPEASGLLMERARDAVGRSVWMGIKDSPHVNSLEDRVDIDGVAELINAVRDYIDFITGINTIPGQAFPEIECAGGKGGMSGPVVADIAKQHLRVCRMLAPELATLSCGGVSSVNSETEIKERLDMGALLVGGAQEPYRMADPAQLAMRWLT